MTYNFKKIEEKWADKWYKDNIYRSEDFSQKPKKYILAEFPYPSGAALHVGHMMRYTVPDMYSRYLRMNGYNVLFPMGWDAFGLPAENYAIKTGIHPAETTKTAIADMKNSLIKMGYSFDWQRELSTIDPDYYKWTQWLFLKFYDQGLAERKEMPIWWCENLKTVLSDEEVLTDKDGNKISERGEHPVERKNLEQWVLKMPEYAEKLLEGLNEVDFPESIKQAQINWIGKSEGAEIDFKVADTQDKLTVFTTRLDTIYGATFLVISPEHPLLEKITTSEHLIEVNEYKNKAKQKSDMERTELMKEKTGVFTGSFAVNPYNGMKLPIWTGEFVVMSYGTGAIMGVPAHDARDYEFAQKYELKIEQAIESSEKEAVIIPYLEEGIVVNSEDFSGLRSDEARSKMLEKAQSEDFGRGKVNYRLRDWIFSRQRYWGEPIPLIYVEPDGHIEKETNLPLILPEVPDYKPTSDSVSPLAKNQEWVNTTSQSGRPAKREINTMPNWAGSCWYFIRYVDPKNDEGFADPEKMRYWLPVDKYFGGAEHTTMHLLYSRFWYRFFYDLGLVPTKEPYSWRLNGGLLLGPGSKKMSKSIGNVIDPMLVADNYGADALRMFISFLGPYEDTYPWNENGIKSTWRLLKTIEDLKVRVSDDVDDKNVEKSYHRMVMNIGDMLEKIKMNTAISEIMIFVNVLKKSGKINTEIWKGFIKVLAPFAPFMAEELWQEINEYEKWNPTNSVHLQSWPYYDEKIVIDETILIPIQINGKVRGEVQVSENDTEELVKEKVQQISRVEELLKGRNITKFLYIPRKIISIVAE